LATLASVAGVIAGGGEEPADQATSLPQECLGRSMADLRRVAGTKVMVRWDGVPTRGLERSVRAGAIGGVIVFPVVDSASGRIDVAGLKDATARLQDIAKRAGQPPLLVATDQEGGPVKRFPDAPPRRSAAELGAAGDLPLARMEGEATGRYLRRAGINVDLAPVLDLAINGSAIASRSFGTNPRVVARVGSAFIEGLQGTGVAATAKHFPGLGRATLNTDSAPASIAAPRRELRADLVPFHAAAAAGVDLTMVGLASYPAYGTRGPAALSERVIDGLLRGRLDYEGVVITDDLDAGAVTAETGGARAAIAAVSAGADVLLYAVDADPPALHAMLAGVRSGSVPVHPLRESCARVIALRESLSAG
jgi:beta-N-acetylhexosaminidase